jgi:hypothetical protein
MAQKPPGVSCYSFSQQDSKIEERLMKALLICSSAFLVLAPLHCEAASTAGADRGSLYNYLNTQEFAEGAKKFYLETIASNDKRKNMIAEAQEDCGGRYEGTSVTLTELSHAIETDKSPIVGNDKDYTLPYSAKATAHWLVVENISCSMHGGHNQSVLHAVLLTGTETQTVTYHYVNGKESGSPVVSGLHRAYTIDADELSEQYRLPYSEQ